MITAIGIFLWLVAGAAACRLLFYGQAPFRARIPELLVLFLLAGLLMFRPHEDIFGGEDPGSYVNSGITYNRRQQAFYVDEMLAKVPPETRPMFYYGHAGYGSTKDACLWIRNPDLALAGPHFQPAYPLMIAAAVRAGTSSWALYVVPLFAVLCALALSALTGRLLPHRWSGMIAFFLYACIPLSVWHGRCARPEIIASFMFFAGAALVMQAWLSRPWRNAFDLVLGALCIGLAPFFHITALMLVIPACAAAALAMLWRGRLDFLPLPLVLFLTTLVFYGQAVYVTDYYGVRRFLDPVMARPWLAAAAYALLAALVFQSWRLRRKKRPAEETPPARPRTLLAGAVLAAALTVFIFTLAFGRQIYGNLPLLGRPVTHYLYLTDFKVMANMLSLPLLALALAGMLFWLTGREERRGLRVALALAVLPAALLTGYIDDFMMTRYLMVAVVPLAVLFLAALAVGIMPRNCGPWLPILICVLMCLAAVHNRTHLITTTEHAGFARFLRPFAETIRANRGMLLCEYSRIAAPLEHFFGIPALGLDNERKTDYAPMEKAWADIMLSDTNRAAFFMTPFGDPRSARFDFEKILAGSFRDCSLKQARRGLPTEVERFNLNLSLFRMKLKAGVQNPEQASTPVTINLDPGNMGLRGFANLREEPYPGQSDDIQSIFAGLGPLPPGTLQAAAPLLLMPRQERIPARWARARAEVLLPAWAGKPALFMIYFLAPDPDGSGSVTVQLKLDKEALGEPRRVRSGIWQWQAWKLPPPAGVQKDCAWVAIETRPAWDPGQPGFPSDLGLLVNSFLCLPAQ